MAGIYIHIPFCRKKCFYCDFYKTTAIKKRPEFVISILNEIKQRADYLGNEVVETIYFGGGTPSLLSITESETILNSLKQVFTISPNTEITLEANPDDLSPDFIKAMKNIGFNRLSIGIQSFSDTMLKSLNRRHTAQQAIQSVNDAVEAGFSDISIDLIYGIPELSRSQWKADLEMAIRLPVSHLSAYHLTYHEGTMFYDWLKKGTLIELPEEESIGQFEMLCEIASANGFEQYEISNFARNGAYSKHNSNYWSGKKYLGLGPSAHSFDINSRQWNVSDLNVYLQRITLGENAFESEVLNITDKINDYLITRIRIKSGVSCTYLETEFGSEIRNRVEQSAESFLNSGHLQQNGDHLSLTQKGIMISDEIIVSLLVE